jgi:DNA-binding beta-propeller fold protein YncE
MSAESTNSILRMITRSKLILALTLGVVVIASPSLYGKDKKDKNKPAPAAAAPETREEKIGKIIKNLDTSKIVWPNPPAITRIRYIDYWSGEKFVDKTTGKPEKKKQSWMERVAGVTTGETVDTKPRWQLVVPNGIAIDSKGKVYVADSKVRAVFIVDTETSKYEMIKNGSDARFQWLTGLAIDDSDRLFVADSGLHHILVFDANRKIEGTIAEGMYDPGNIAIDNENRLLYVTDAEQDLVLVYDSDPPYKLLRKIGKEGTKHTSTMQGELAKPTGIAVDQDGNVFVADTLNDRIQVFDADGNFVRAFGKAGDGPGYFARPKGLAIDGDGHLWVADAVQDRLQVYTAEGRLLIYLGGHGMLPGQFQSLVNVAIDKNNRVFTTEQLAGRLQIFRYINNTEARAELDKRNAEAKKKLEEKRSSKTVASDSKPVETPAKQ